MLSKKVLKMVMTFILVFACAAFGPSQTSKAAEKSYSVNDLSVKFTSIDNKLVDKQNTSDEALSTTNKTIVGAINELNTKITSANTQLETILGE